MKDAGEDVQVNSQNGPAPRVLVFSMLFPGPADAQSGAFIRQRMFRVARHLPLVVVAPRPWMPGQGLIRLFRPHYRPPAPAFEIQDGIEVHRPRFLSIPGLLKRWDSLFMALGSYLTVRRLQRRLGCNLIDAHFGWPDGHAATWLGRWLGLPVSITLRGSELVHTRTPAKARRLGQAMQRATRVFAVSRELCDLAIRLGADAAKASVVGNAVDSERFRPEPRAEARARYGLAAEDGPVLVSVGWLVEGKGFHRVIACLPELLQRHPNLSLLVVGGPSPSENMEPRLRAQVAELGLEARVRFLGALPQTELRWALSAADVFVLSTRREGWANVLLEAMACGLPVVTTRVGGNPEVVCRDELGELVPFDDPAALRDAITRSLEREWDRAAIRAHAVANSWDSRVAVLCEHFSAMVRP
ncbi:MAG: glycosyltransferase [Betaproteobacteria bacterium]|nr:glycosyltransferase [Betaproteobacteria bacterium]